MSFPRVIGLVAIVVVGSLGCTFGLLWLLKRETASEHDRKIRADISVIKEGLDAYAMMHAGDYPDSLQALLTPDLNGKSYLDQTLLPLDHTLLPKDPWGEEYGYDPPSPSHPQPRVYTLGRDKSVGGTGDDADIDYEAIVNGR